MLILGSVGEAGDARKQLTFIWSVLWRHTKSQDRLRLPRAQFIFFKHALIRKDGWQMTEEKYVGNGTEKGYIEKILKKMKNHVAMYKIIVI